MKKSSLFSAIMLTVASFVAAQPGERIPQIGYVYPAGGSVGSEFEAVVGGQYLRGIDGAFVSGEGVEVTTVTLIGPQRNIGREQRMMIQVKMMELNTKHWQKLYADGLVQREEPPWTKRLEKSREELEKRLAEMDEKPEWPNHYYLRDLENKDVWQLGHARSMMAFDRKKIQPNAQIEELAVLKIKIAPDAPVGERELRLQLRQGITNAVVFQVGNLPEWSESEPNDPDAPRGLVPDPAPLELPVLVNGQVMPGDVDQVRFVAKKGQKLVIDVAARRLVPFLADAVPGWFQAVVVIRDEQGEEIAYADDFRFDPDPVMLFEAPDDGVYTLEIRDSIYRGRQDFVYRASISERPFITGIFPLGIQQNQPKTVQVHGWNLKTRSVSLEAADQNPRIRRATITEDGIHTNAFLYAVDSMAGLMEAEPNDTREQAQAVTLDHIIDGRVDKDGDADVFRFDAKQGDTIVAEVDARRLRSPVDSLVQIMDASGKVLAWNDDYVDKVGHLHRDMGLLTHHADSYLMCEIPKDGVYYARMTDTRGHGGEDFAYRLRLSHPRPDFELLASPSCLAQRTGCMLVDIYALRRDGYNGPIEVFVGGESPEFELQGASIPAGADHVLMTLGQTTRKEEAGMEQLSLMGRITEGAKTIERPVSPADDRMQAFLWRHLAPSGEMLVQTRRWGGLPLSVDVETPLLLSPGGAIEIPITFRRNKWTKDMDFEIFDAPEGIRLKEVVKSENGAKVILVADAEKCKAGSAKNLIVEAFRVVEFGKADKDGKRSTRRNSMGYLPAMPVRIQ
ncbi:MAG: hypothetical protein ACOC2L_05170 [Candidatus Sumerlaeota bacterium]